MHRQNPQYVNASGQAAQTSSCRRSGMRCTEANFVIHGGVCISSTVAVTDHHCTSVSKTQPQDKGPSPVFLVKDRKDRNPLKGTT